MDLSDLTFTSKDCEDDKSEECTGRFCRAIQISALPDDEGAPEDISVIVEQAQASFTFESHGFQEFPDAFPETAMKALNQELARNQGQFSNEMLKDVWPSVKKELMKKMHKQTCRARLGAPAGAQSICARRTDMHACEGDRMCYINTLVDFQFLSSHLAKEVSESPSGSEYIKKYMLKNSRHTKDGKSIIDLLTEVNLYRRARLLPTTKAHLYKTNDIKNSSGYERVSVNDPDLISKKKKYRFDIEMGKIEAIDGFIPPSHRH
jgi:hypothetical protein